MSSGRSQSSRSNDSTCCNWAVGLRWPLVRARHTTARMSSQKTSFVLTIPVCDGEVVLEHGGGGIVSVAALGWLTNFSKARGGQVEEAFGNAIVGRLLFPSGCGKVVGRKIFPTSTSSSHFCKTHRDSSQSLNLRATHSSPSKHQKHPSSSTECKKTFRWHCPQVKEGWYKCMECHCLLARSNNPCPLRDPQCFKAGDKIRSDPQVGGVAT